MRTYQITLITILLAAEALVAVGTSGVLSVVARATGAPPPIITPSATWTPAPVATSAPILPTLAAPRPGLDPATPSPARQPNASPVLVPLPTMTAARWTATPTVATPTPTSAALLPTPESVHPGEIVLVAGTAGRGLTVRREPSTRSTPLAAWPDGAPLTIAGPPAIVDGDTWYRVRDSQGHLGWVAAEFVIPARRPTTLATPRRWRDQACMTGRAGVSLGAALRDRKPRPSIGDPATPGLSPCLPGNAGSALPSQPASSGSRRRR